MYQGPMEILVSEEHASQKIWLVFSPLLKKIKLILQRLRQSGRKISKFERIGIGKKCPRLSGKKYPRIRKLFKEWITSLFRCVFGCLLKIEFFGKSITTVKPHAGRR